MKLIAGYAPYYLEGREERLLKVDIDTAEIARLVIEEGGSLHDRLHEAVSKAAGTLAVDRKKRQWIADCEDDIRAAGHNNDHAYEAWCEGRIDELVGSLESEVLEEMGALIHGDEDDDEDEDDDDDDDDEDDKG